MILLAETVVIDDDVFSPGWLRVEHGHVAASGGGEPPDTPTETLSGLVLPGFTDIHVHGALGFDFASATAAQATQIAAFHASSGSTSIVASVATSPLDDMHATVTTLAPLVRSGVLDGIHLEGPYLSTAHRGAHDPGLLRQPTPDEILSLLAAADGTIRMVTIAPELPDAEASIALLLGAGVTVALGHSDAGTDTATAAISRGASVITHVFNGMRPFHHRDPGLLGAALVDDRVFLEAIVDGHHLSRETVELIRRVASARYLLVSDAMAATGLGDGDYTVAGSRVSVRNGIARTRETGSLAGSTGTIAQGAARLWATHRVAPRELADATSQNARRAAQLPRQALRPGDRADLVNLKSPRGPVRVMKGGRWLA